MRNATVARAYRYIWFMTTDPLSPEFAATVAAGYTFDSPTLALGALVQGEEATESAQVLHPARDAQPPRPRRRRHRHRQDAHPAAHGRGAQRGRRSRIRRRHQGRPHRHGDRRRTQGLHRQARGGHRPNLVPRVVPARVLQPWRHRLGRAHPHHGHRLWPAADEQGAWPQRHPGIVALAHLPLGGHQRARPARPQGPARGDPVPHLNRGQGRTQGHRRRLPSVGRRDPA